MVKPLLIAGLVLAASAWNALAVNHLPDLQVNVPPEVFKTQGQQQPAPCNQCCIYQNQSYTEGSVVKMEGVLLQCQRDEHVLGTNPLMWRRVNP